MSQATEHTKDELRILRELSLRSRVRLGQMLEPGEHNEPVTHDDHMVIDELSDHGLIDIYNACLTPTGVACALLFRKKVSIAQVAKTLTGDDAALVGKVIDHVDHKLTEA